MSALSIMIIIRTIISVIDKHMENLKDKKY